MNPSAKQIGVERNEPNIATGIISYMSINVTSSN